MNREGCRKWRKVIALMIVLQIFLTGCVKAPANENVLQPETEIKQTGKNAGTSGTPVLNIETVLNDYYDGINDRIVVRVKYDKISLSGNGFEVAAQAISEWNQQDIEKIEALEEEALTEGFDLDFSSYVVCTRIDSRVISFKQRWYKFVGESREEYLGVNFDVVSGKKLSLAELLTDEEGFKQKAIEIIIEKLQETPYAENYEQGYGADIESAFLQDNRWYLDALGIVFYCDPLGNGSYTSGNILVTVPYEDVSEYMKPEYCGMQGSGIAYLPANEAVRINLSDSGAAENASGKGISGAELSSWDTVKLVYEEMSDTEDIWWVAYVIVNDSREEMGRAYWGNDAYLLQRESGKTYLLFEVDCDYHFYSTYLCDITDGKMIKTEIYDANIVQVTNGNILLWEKVEAFGTYFATTPYIIDDESGELVRTDLYDTNAEDNADCYALNVIRELPVVINGESTCLQPGAQIVITALDDNGIAYFMELNTGTEGEIHYTRENGEEYGAVYVNGVSEALYFEYLPYSG